jgi:hypothetical protein
LNGAAGGGEISPAAYSKAVLNILEDFDAERQRLKLTQKAILNIAEDGESERARLRETQKAVLNILDDLEAEKTLIEKARG